MVYPWLFANPALAAPPNVRPLPDRPGLLPIPGQRPQEDLFGPPPTAPGSSLGFLEALGNDLMGSPQNLRDYFGFPSTPMQLPQGPTFGERLATDASNALNFMTADPAALAKTLMTGSPTSNTPIVGGLVEHALAGATRDEEDLEKLELQVLGEQALSNAFLAPMRLNKMAAENVGQPVVDFATGAGKAVVEGLSGATDYLSNTVGENEQAAEAARPPDLNKLKTAGSHVNVMDIEPHVAGLALQLQEQIGRPLLVTSGYRDPDYNKKVGGAKGSQHLHGNAIDISTQGMSEQEVQQLVQNARNLGFRGVGVYNGSVHLDVGPDRKWGSDYTRDTAPDWLLDLGPAGEPTQLPQPPQAGGPNYLPYPDAPNLPPPPEGVQVDYQGMWDESGMRPPTEPNYDLIRNRPDLEPPIPLPPQAREDYMKALAATAPQGPDEKKQSDRVFMAALAGLAAGAAKPSQGFGHMLANVGASGLGAVMQAKEMNLQEDKEYQSAAREHAALMAQAQYQMRIEANQEENFGRQFRNQEALGQWEGDLAAEEARLSHDQSLQDWNARVFDARVRMAEAEANATNRFIDRNWQYTTELARINFEHSLAERGDILRVADMQRATVDTNAMRQYERDTAQAAIDTEHRNANLPKIEIKDKNIISYRVTPEGQRVAQVTPIQTGGGLFGGLAGGLGGGDAGDINDLYRVAGEMGPRAGPTFRRMLDNLMATSMGRPDLAASVLAEEIVERAPVDAPEFYEAISEQARRDAEERNLLPGTEEFAEFVDSQMLFYAAQSIVEDPNTINELSKVSPSAKMYLEVFGTRP